MIAQPTSPYDADVPPRPDGGTSRYAALATAAAAIRVRRGARIPVEQILLAAAAVLFPLGLVFILLGWEGAAHNGHTYAQIDYLISGGIFGLGLSVAGGFMYFGYWLSRQLGESRRQNALTLQAMQRLEDLLDFAVSSRAAEGTAPPVAVGSARAVTGPAGEPAGDSQPGGTTRRPARGRSNRAPQDTGRAAAGPTGRGPAAGLNGAALYATPRGTLLHRPDCPVVARRTDLKAVDPGAEGYGFCTMCDAAGAPA